MVSKHRNMRDRNVERTQRRFVWRLGLARKLVFGRRSVFVELDVWGLHGPARLRVLLGHIRVHDGNGKRTGRRNLFRLVVVGKQLLAR